MSSSSRKGSSASSAGAEVSAVVNPDPVAAIVVTSSSSSSSSRQPLNSGQKNNSPTKMSSSGKQHPAKKSELDVDQESLDGLTSSTSADGKTLRSSIFIHALNRLKRQKHTQNFKKLGIYTPVESNLVLKRRAQLFYKIK